MDNGDPFSANPNSRFRYLDIETEYDNYRYVSGSSYIIPKYSAEDYVSDRFPVIS
ncbi:hypothetical protein DSECCO2_484590 [anaerobic digester metagenome]|jgi:hypothetical protein|nr:hypothetical protein MmazTMA_20060 [Methanosarcina mazei]